MTHAGSISISVTDISESEAEAKDDIELQVNAESRHRTSSANRKNAVLLEWSDIQFSVDIPASGPPCKRTPPSHRSILNGISGHAAPGELLAIMGSSGAGKTSLLNILSRRVNLGHSNLTCTGDVKVNSAEVSDRLFKKHAAYIMQEDVLMSTLTPREAFQVSADLRLPARITPGQRRARVEHTLEVLGLSACADTWIGDEKIKGISGGEKKRTSIGVELLTDPSLLFVDEPTSGLDSFTALQVMKMLEKLASEGRTIISTIHQPSSEIFAVFDKLLLLAQGKVVFMGKASDAVEYFDGAGYPVPTYSNPADHFINILHDSGSEEDSHRVQDLVQKWDEWEATNNRELDVTYPPLTHRKKNGHDARSGVGRELAVLTKRTIKNYTRHPASLRVRMGQSVIFALMTGAIYYNVNNEQSGIADRQGGLFFVCMSQVMSSVMSVVLVFPMERALFLREKANNMYHTNTYFLSKTFSELPFQLIFPTVFSVISYFLIGLKGEVDAFILFILMNFIMGNAGQSLGLVVGVVSRDTSAAVGLTPLTIIPFMLFSGFFVTLENIPVWLRWIQYTSIFKYAFANLLINELRGQEFSCEGTAGGSSQCFETGEQVLSAVGVDEDDFWPYVLYSLLIVVGFRLIAYLLLRRVAARHA